MRELRGLRTVKEQGTSVVGARVADMTVSANLLCAIILLR